MHYAVPPTTEGVGQGSSVRVLCVRCLVVSDLGNGGTGSGGGVNGKESERNLNPSYLLLNLHSSVIV